MLDNLPVLMTVIGVESGFDSAIGEYYLISHVSLGTTNLQRARDFYAAALNELGFVQVFGNENAVGFGRAGGADRLTIFLRPRGEYIPADSSYAEDQSEAIPHNNGFHLAFEAPTRESVGSFYRTALQSGGSDNGPPGLRPHYGGSYYAAFVIDPDGHRIEAVHQ